jgi:hypothetical protein
LGVFSCEDRERLRETAEISEILRTSPLGTSRAL